MWSRVFLDMAGMTQLKNYDKMSKYTSFSALFLRFSLPPETKILRTGISFMLKTTDIDNKYYLYSRTCTNISSVIEGVYFAVSYASVAGICSLCIIISIAYGKGLEAILDISNAFHNTILPNPA